MTTLTEILNRAEAVSFGIRDRALTVYETAANVHCFPTVKALAEAEEVVIKAERGREMFREGASHAEVANEVGGMIADRL